MNIEDVRAKIDNLNKPKGSLGRLEEIAEQLCLIQGTLCPALTNPHHLLFGGDHGIEREGVSLSPREVTWQQMINFTRGGGGVNMFCRQHGFTLRIIDVGVDHDLSGYPAIIDRKIARGTNNFLHDAAMDEAQYARALAVGAEQVDACHAAGCNVIAIGEMGIANTSPSSVWMSIFCGIPLHKCVGAGSGLSPSAITHKLNVLEQAVAHFYASAESAGPAPARQSESIGTHEVIRYFGGFEMVAAIGAMLRAADLGMVILIDGFIMTACALAAMRISPSTRKNMVFTHCGNEAGHRLLLEAIGAKAILDLGLRLGEGTGALCAYPIVESAARMMSEMNNFNDAKITKYF